MTWRRRGSLLAIFTLTLVAALCASGCGTPSDPAAGAAERTIRVGSFTFASLASVMAHVIREKAIDRKHGLHLEVVPYGSVAAYYAGLTSGEVDTIAGGPLVFQKMRLQGVPIVISNTYATLASLVVISTVPNARNLTDLRGKRLAADMASSEYQILRLLAERQGLRLDSQMEVLQSSPAVARAHLQSGEVEAILTFEPAASLVLREVPGARIVSQAEDALLRIGIEGAWLLVSLMREDWISRHPEGPARWGEALDEAAEFIHLNPGEADEIFSRSANFPRGVLLEAIQEGRVKFIIRSALQERESLRLLFNIAQQSGFAAGIPGVDSFYVPK